MADIYIESDLSGETHISSDVWVSYNVVSLVSGSSLLTSYLTVSPGYQAPVRYLPPCRTIQSGRMILDQVDLFLSDGKTRSQEVIPSDLQLKLFLNGSQVDWPLVSGVGIQDVRITSGRVYWTEFTTGYYNIRFYPNILGVWRVVITYSANDQVVSLSYDVIPQVSASISGMKSSFIRR